MIAKSVYLLMCAVQITDLVIRYWVIALISGIKQRTCDRIEDYGEHFYFVFNCDENWSVKTIE